MNIPFFQKPRAGTHRLSMFRLNLPQSEIADVSNPMSLILASRETFHPFFPPKNPVPRNRGKIWSRGLPFVRVRQPFALLSMNAMLKQRVSPRIGSQFAL